MISCIPCWNTKTQAQPIGDTAVRSHDSKEVAGIELRFGHLPDKDRQLLTKYRANLERFVEALQSGRDYRNALASTKVDDCVAMTGVLHDLLHSLMATGRWETKEKTLAKAQWLLSQTPPPPEAYINQKEINTFKLHSGRHEGLEPCVIVETDISDKYNLSDQYRVVSKKYSNNTRENYIIYDNKEALLNSSNCTNDYESKYCKSEFVGKGASGVGLKLQTKVEKFELNDEGEIFDDNDRKYHNNVNAEVALAQQKGGYEVIVPALTMEKELKQYDLDEIKLKLDKRIFQRVNIKSKKNVYITSMRLVNGNNVHKKLVLADKSTPTSHGSNNKEDYNKFINDLYLFNKDGFYHTDFISNLFSKNKSGNIRNIMYDKEKGKYLLIDTQGSLINYHNFNDHDITVTAAPGSAEFNSKNEKYKTENRKCNRELLNLPNAKYQWLMAGNINDDKAMDLIKNHIYENGFITDEFIKENANALYIPDAAKKDLNLNIASLPLNHASLRSRQSPEEGTSLSGGFKDEVFE